MAAQALFVLSAVLGIDALRKMWSPQQKPWHFWLSAPTLVLNLLVVAIYAQPRAVPGYSGRLSRGRITLLSAQSPDRLSGLAKQLGEHFGHSGMALEWGDSGAYFDLIGEGRFVVPFMLGSELSIAVADGDLSVSTQITDKRTGKVVAIVEDNAFKIRESERTDINYTSDSLEVIDAYGRVALQVRLRPDHIQLQGEWWLKEHDGYLSGARLGRYPYRCPEWALGSKCAFMQALLPHDDPDEPHIERMFQYPSNEHPHELRKQVPTPAPAPDWLLAETVSHDVALKHRGLIFFPGGMHLVFMKESPIRQTPTIASWTGLESTPPR